MDRTLALRSRWTSAVALAATVSLLVGCSPASTPGVTKAPAGSAAPGASQGATAAPSSASGFSATQEAVAGGSGVIGIPAGGIDHLEPTLWWYSVSWQIAYATCTPLLTFADAAGEAGGQVIGGLADMPTVAADGMTYTFKLRPGIKFADGKPITGEDIVYTWQRMLSPALASPAAGFFSGVVGAPEFSAGTSTDLPGVTASGDTVTFKLSRPIGSFLKQMTMPFTCTVPVGTPKEPIEDGSILGTGPYVVQSYTPNRDVVLVKNPNYAAAVLGSRGKFDTITLQLNVDPAQASLLIRAGKLATYMDKMAPADATQALNDPALAGRVFAGTLPTTVYLWFNTAVAPFDNVKVRQAVNYALNREAILRVWGGPSQGVISNQVLPPTMEGWEAMNLFPSAGDTAKAQSLLAESGVPMPINTVMWAQQSTLQLAQAVQAQLKDVGINLEIKSGTDAVVSAQIMTPANGVPMGTNNWTQDYPDPDDFFGPLLNGNRITPTNNSNFGNFNVPSINAEIEAMDLVSDATRAAKWNAIDREIIEQQAAWAPLLNPSRVTLLAEGTCGYVFHPVYILDLTTLGNCQ